MPKMILVGGGARSGKSRFALDLARDLGAPRTFIATAQALDGEMADRIARHRAERGADFRTVEEPLALQEALHGVFAGCRGDEVVLVDCLTLWVSNLLTGMPAAENVDAEFDRLAEELDRRRATTILVTNEVGLGLVPQTPLGRAFRDAMGTLHQRLAAQADEMYVAMMGVVLRLHPSPVELATPQSRRQSRTPGRPLWTTG